MLKTKYYLTMQDFALLHDILDLVEAFQKEQQAVSAPTIDGFKNWIVSNAIGRNSEGSLNLLNERIDWEGKDKGRSPESVINTLIVHMNRYAKAYSKSAIHDSEFTTQEEFIYLINLKAFGSMSKMDLIKKNVQEKSVGMQIINRLINRGWVSQRDSVEDKRSKLIGITVVGEKILAKYMDKIRDASKIVTGNLTEAEKIELIRLLTKLDHFHKPIYLQQVESKELLEVAKSYAAGE